MGISAWEWDTRMPVSSAYQTKVVETLTGRKVSSAAGEKEGEGEREKQPPQQQQRQQQVMIK